MCLQPENTKLQRGSYDWTRLERGVLLTHVIFIYYSNLCCIFLAAVLGGVQQSCVSERARWRKTPIRWNRIKLSRDDRPLQGYAQREQRAAFGSTTITAASGNIDLIVRNERFGKKSPNLVMGTVFAVSCLPEHNGRRRGWLQRLAVLTKGINLHFLQVLAGDDELERKAVRKRTFLYGTTFYPLFLSCFLFTIGVHTVVQSCLKDLWGRKTQYEQY